MPPRKGKGAAPTHMRQATLSRQGAVVLPKRKQPLITSLLPARKIGKASALLFKFRTTAKLVGRLAVMYKEVSARPGNSAALQSAARFGVAVAEQSESA